MIDKKIEKGITDFWIESFKNEKFDKKLIERMLINTFIILTDMHLMLKKLGVWEEFLRQYEEEPDLLKALLCLEYWGDKDHWN